MKFMVSDRRRCGFGDDQFLRNRTGGDRDHEHAASNGKLKLFGAHSIGALSDRVGDAEGKLSFGPDTQEISLVGIKHQYTRKSVASPNPDKTALARLCFRRLRRFAASCYSCPHQGAEHSEPKLLHYGRSGKGGRPHRDDWESENVHLQQHTGRLSLIQRLDFVVGFEIRQNVLEKLTEIVWVFQIHH